MGYEQTLKSENTLPSSPQPAVFSDEPTRASSPPSSPPGFPWEQQKTLDEMPTVLQRPTANAFSILGKRKALDNISDNTRPAKKTTQSSTKPTSKSLTQMQISLGQEVQKKCRACGMEYIASSAEDRKLHDKYHKQNIEGFDLGKDFVQKTHKFAVFKGANAGDSICAVDCDDKFARRRRGQAVLEIVQRELGAVEIPETSIWDPDTCEPDFIAYLYVRKTKCVGFLLVQRIEEAYRVIEPPMLVEEPSEVGPSRPETAAGSLSALRARQKAAAELMEQRASAPLELSRGLRPARMGISRVWTSPNHRQQNIASTMLDIALTHHNQRADREANSRISMRTDSAMDGINDEVRARLDAVMPVKEMIQHLDAIMPVMERIQSKDLVAFSQPTEAGTRLARKWFGQMYGWGVYLD